MKIGFVGLGNMGGPMAGHLVDGGHTVSVFDLAAERLDALVERGARRADSPADAAGGAELVGIAVMDGAQVEDVTMGARGIFEAAGDDTVVAVHSTVHPATVQRVAAAAPAGVTVLDAPISGGVRGARDATLCVMVGGETSAFARARVAFATFGDLVLHLGPLGAGLAAKLARNLTGYISLLGAQEGRRLADAAGVDTEAFREILDHTGAVSPMMRDMLTWRGGDAVYADDPQPLIDLAAKDMEVITALAADLALELPGARVTREHIADAIGPREAPTDR